MQVRPVEIRVIESIMVVKAGHKRIPLSGILLGTLLSSALGMEVSFGVQCCHHTSGIWWCQYHTLFPWVLQFLLLFFSCCQKKKRMMSHLHSLSKMEVHIVFCSFYFSFCFFRFSQSFLLQSLWVCRSGSSWLKVGHLWKRIGINLLLGILDKLVSF